MDASTMAESPPTKKRKFTYDETPARLLDIPTPASTPLETVEDRLAASAQAEPSSTRSIEDELYGGFTQAPSAAIDYFDTLKNNGYKHTAAERSISFSTAGGLPMEDPKFLKDLKYIEELLDYTFVHPEYLREALFGEKLAVQIAGRLVIQGNQRLALMGDTVLKTAVLDNWLWRNETCGSTSERFDRLASNANLCANGKIHGIDRMIVKADGGRMISGKNTTATAVEAIIGAVWLDSSKDLGAVKDVIRVLLGEDAE